MSKSKTSSFGISKRENHDSTVFYERQLYKSAKNLVFETGHEFPDENPIPSTVENRLFNSSSESMTELPDRSIHLAVTSPPYNVGKDYDQDLSLDEYLGFLNNVFEEVFRVLAIGGRFAINIANIGRKPYIPLHAYIASSLLDIGFLMRGEVIWDKGSSAGTSTAWGSWKSPSNPVLRDVHEYILIFSKGDFSRKIDQSQATISKDDFLSLTKSIWSFQAESAKRAKHPAPFPEELPRRLIELYTQVGDVVLDPFMGVGTSAVAAKRLERNYVGYDTEKKYLEIAEERLAGVTPPLPL